MTEGAIIGYGSKVAALADHAAANSIWIQRDVMP